MAQRLSIDGVEARAEVRVTSQDVSEHEGDDGPCSVIRLQAEGPMTSDDPRLAGIFVADVVMLVDAHGRGAGRDDWKIVDPDTRRVKAQGMAHGILNNPNPMRALSVGRLEDGCRLFANTRVMLPPPDADGPIVIEYGGPGLADPANRGVAVAGSCPGLLDRD